MGVPEVEGGVEGARIELNVIGGVEGPFEVDSLEGARK